MHSRHSRFSPEIRPGTARQQLGMTICACALTGSAVIMLGAFLLAGNFGVRQLVCSLIGSGAAVVFGICLLSLLPTLVRTMRAQLDQPGDAGPAIKSFFRIAMIALVATACTVMGGGAFSELSSDARQGPQTRVVTSCENFQTFTEHGHRGSTYYRNVLPSILTTESRVTSTSRRTRKTSSRNQQAPTTLSTRHVSSALSRPLSSSTTTHAVGS